MLLRSTSLVFHLLVIFDSSYVSKFDIEVDHKLLSGDIPFEDLSTVETVRDSSLASTPSEKKTSIMGTISGNGSFTLTICV